MALIKPVLNNVPAWDVGNGQIFTFSIPEGEGDVVTGNILTILDNDTDEIVYKNQIISYQYSNSVPANASGLTNGTYYSAYIQTLNASGGVSEASDSIQFYCYSTPTWDLNIVNGSIIDDSFINPQIHYEQIEEELLYSYNFILYNNSQTEIASSGIQYVTSQSSDVYFNYLFDGLDNNTVYYIRVTGTTVEDTLLDTGFIRFATSFTQLEEYNMISVQVNCNEGYVTYYSMACKIDGEYEGSPSNPVYVNGAINLSNASVTWLNDGSASYFDITNNFIIKMVFYNFNYKDNGIGFIDSNGAKVVLNCIKNPMSDSLTETVIGTATIYDYNYGNNNLRKDNYFIFTNPINKPSNNKKILLQLKKINNIYDIQMGELA